MSQGHRNLVFVGAARSLADFNGGERTAPGVSRPRVHQRAAPWSATKALDQVFDRLGVFA